MGRAGVGFFCLLMSRGYLCIPHRRFYAGVQWWCVPIDHTPGCGYSAPPPTLVCRLLLRARLACLYARACDSCDSHAHGHGHGHGHTHGHARRCGDERGGVSGGQDAVCVNSGTGSEIWTGFARHMHWPDLLTVDLHSTPDSSSSHHKSTLRYARVMIQNLLCIYIVD